MKKARIFMMIFIMLIMFLGITNTVFALGDGFNKDIFNKVNNGSVDTNVESLGIRIYGTVFTILRVLAVCGVVYTGVKYMYAGANDKGQMKSTLIYVVIGTILVFATKGIIDFIIKLDLF